MNYGIQAKPPGGYGMNRKILVTGGTGFIGSRVVKRLIEVGDIPIVLKRSFSNIWRVKEFIDKVITYDIDKVSIEQVFRKEKIDGVINLAVSYKKYASISDIDELIDVNVKLPVRLLELCKLSNIRLFVTAGSYFQYSHDDSVLSDYRLSAARNLYSASKSALGDIMRYYSKYENVKTAELIIFTPYGEMDHEERLIPHIIKQKLSGNKVNLTQGFQRLNLVYVEDIADAFVKAIDLTDFQEPNLIFNIANKESYSIREIITVMEELFGSRIEVDWGVKKAEELDLSKNYSVDTEQAEKILKWRPRFNIYDGLRNTIAYYRRKYDAN